MPHPLASLRSFADIARLSYSPNDLHSAIRPSDEHYFGLPKDLPAALAVYSTEFYKTHGKPIGLKTTQKRGKVIYRVASLQDHLFMRRTDHILRRALRINRPDRNTEIRQLITILETEPQYSILRVDIKSFFESVTFSNIISQLESQGFRNHSTIAHLRSINSYLINNHAYHGLPRGLAISSTLADYALREIDQTLAIAPEIIYYTRYVDDICAVHLGYNNTLLKRLCDQLHSLGLGLNSKKTQLREKPFTQKLDFLGYSLESGKPFKIWISSSKLAKAKHRIALSIKAYAEDKSESAFDDFYDRISFLSSTAKISSLDRDAPIYAGFKHVYNACTEAEIDLQMRELDTFFRAIIRSNHYKLGKIAKSKMTPGQTQSLSKLSFRAGRSREIISSFRPERLAVLKNAWKHE